ncbi:hypothetical protein GCM10027020_27810 [Nocardioides salsibiostraticola]
MDSDDTENTPPQEPSDSAPTPTDLIVEVRRQRRVAAKAEAQILRLAVEWAHSHPELDGDEVVWWRPGKKGQAYAESVGAAMDEDGSPDPTTVADFEELEWFAIPQIRWDAAAPFAAANAMSTTAGRVLLRDALVLFHRLPKLYRRVVHGMVPLWKARKVAVAVLGRPDDVVAYVDEKYAPLAASSGLGKLEEFLDEAMLRLYPEQHEHDRLDALGKRHATLEEGDLSLTNGLAYFQVCGDWLDLKEFDLTVSAVAEALKHTEAGEHESLDTRRSMAVGVLADPEAAAQLLKDHEAAGGKPRRRLELVLHLTPETLAGRDVVVTDDGGRVWFADQVAEWASRPDTSVSVRGLIDLTDLGDHDDHDGEDAYVASTTLRESVILRDTTCVFPFCRRTARACDLDHICPFRESGVTCECNLAPLCRHHHQLKTHAGWRYRVVEPGIYRWTDPHRQHFLRTRDGTIDMTVIPGEDRPEGSSTAA